jgi:hypothetical protein
MGEASWINTISKQETTSKLALKAWELRHGPFAEVAEALRIAVQQPKLIQQSLGSKRVRHALRNSTLDYIGNKLLDNLEPQPIEDIASLREAVRNDEVVTITTSNAQIGIVLRNAKWKELAGGSRQEWMRPKPTKYVVRPSSIQWPKAQ